jgi:hypothetical protein
MKNRTIKNAAFQIKAAADITENSFYTVAANLLVLL